MRTFFYTRRLGLWLALGVLLVDQLTKVWALGALLQHNVSVIEGFLSFTLSLNRGVAFSFFANITHSWLPYVLVAFSAIISLLFVGYMRAGSCLFQAGLGCIVGGAIGNGVDRLIFGGVVDFIHVHYGLWSFPIFNGADVAINIGIALILADAFFEKSQPAAPQLYKDAPIKTPKSSKETTKNEGK